MSGSKILQTVSAISVSCTVLFLCTIATAEETVGKRPYEMVWANRTEDTRPPLVDFENLDGWTVECRDAVAQFTPSRGQQLWGKHVGRLVYCGDGENPAITIRPPKPMLLSPPFDCVNLWLYGNNIFGRDKTTPPVGITVLLRGGDNQLVRVSMGKVRWKEWWVMHCRLTSKQSTILKDGASLEGIEITGGKNKTALSEKTAIIGIH